LNVAGDIAAAFALVKIVLVVQSDVRKQIRRPFRVVFLKKLPVHYVPYLMGNEYPDCFFVIARIVVYNGSAMMMPCGCPSFYAGWHKHDGIEPKRPAGEVAFG